MVWACGTIREKAISQKSNTKKRLTKKKEKEKYLISLVPYKAGYSVSKRSRRNGLIRDDKAQYVCCKVANVIREKV